MNVTRLCSAVTGLLLAAGARPTAAAEPVARTFSFGGTVPGATAVPAGTAYTADRGYGLEPGPAGGGPFAFSVRLPEGNYRVTVHLGDPAAAADTAVKAEARRVMWPLTRTAAGQTTAATFAVNVRTPRIDDQTSVAVSARERAQSARTWDDKLTLEFVGTHPAVTSVEVRPADAGTVTVFLAGDSTVTDQAVEPWAAWGQLLPQFLSPNVAVANYAESGRTLRSFKGERRQAKLLAGVKPGDYVFVQFGHNDMKEKGPGVGAFTSFSDSLRSLVADVRAKGGRPVLLTPMNRRKFDGGSVVQTFGDYPEATRRVAAELAVPLIDLQAMSKPLYEAFGPDRSTLLFVHFPAGTFPGQDKPLRDDTHFRAFGADQIARCVVQGVRDLHLPLAAEVRDTVPSFDPSRPGDPAAYDLPASPVAAVVVPEGR